MASWWWRKNLTENAYPFLFKYLFSYVFKVATELLKASAGIYVQ